MNTKNIKASVLTLQEYRIPQDRVTVKLNQNESPFDVPVGIKRKILKKLRKKNWNRYPLLEPVELVQSISMYTGHSDKGILVGNSSNELIQTVFLATCHSQDPVVVVSPGFSIYPHVAKILNLNVEEISLLKDFSFDTASIIKKGENARVIILASPNNPTGTVLDIQDIQTIAENIKGIFVVDEAYLEFYGNTALQLLKPFSNIIIIRTFSKAFSLAGLRAGYLLAEKKMITQLKKVKLPFSLGIFQQIAGEILLKHADQISQFVETIIIERETLFSKLKEIPGVCPIPSMANFILLEVKEKSAEDVFLSLLKQGVLVRYFGSQGLENMLRVTVGSPHENRIFLKELGKVMEEI